MDAPAVIRLTPQVYRDYRRTIARHPPETFAVLGGRLDDPGLVTELRFCPPARREGQYDYGAAHVLVDADLMNWIIVNEWMPNEQYVLGIWHSHPGSVNRPSGRSGDLGLFDKCLGSDEAHEIGWDHMLAPITTFGAGGDDEVHGWIYSRNDNTPRPVDVVIEHAGQHYSPAGFKELAARVVALPAPDDRDEDAPVEVDRVKEAAERPPGAAEADLVVSLARQRRRVRMEPGFNVLERFRMSRQLARFERSTIERMLGGS